MFAQMDPTATATWAGILVTIIGCAVGSYVAVRIGLASLSIEVKSLRSFVEAIARGDTGLMGELRQKVDSHSVKIAELDSRVSRVQGQVLQMRTEHGINHPHCGANTTERTDES